MVLMNVLTSGGGGGGGYSPFELFDYGVRGSVRFGPRFYPKDIVVSKEHKNNRSQNPCSGEDVTKIGKKNREIHIVGLLRKSEMEAFDDLLDYMDTVTLISLTWSGEVSLEDGELHGPVGYDPNAKEYLWEYTLNLLSTGEDERDHNTSNGIISDGTDDEWPDSLTYPGSPDYDG